MDESDDLVRDLVEAGYKVAFAFTPTPAQQREAAERLALQGAELDMLSGTLPPLQVEWEPLSRQQNIAWDERPDKLWLLTPAEFEQVPDGVTLVCISGKTAVKGTDYIDQDTRGGFIAWGLFNSQLPPRPDRNESNHG